LKKASFGSVFCCDPLGRLVGGVPLRGTDGYVCLSSLETSRDLLVSYLLLLLVIIAIEVIDPEGLIIRRD